MNRGDRNELACTKRATRGSSTPPAGLSRAGGEENPREATQGHPETAHLHPALLKEGREKKERPGVHDFRRSHQERTSAQWKKSLKGEKSLRKLTKANTSTATKANQNICHNLILSSKPIATPRKKGGRKSLTSRGYQTPGHM